MSGDPTNDLLPFFTPYGEWAILVTACMVAAVAAFVWSLDRFDRRRSRRHWEKWIAKRAAYVDAGCPFWEETDDGGWTFAADPFRVDFSGVRPIREFPDLYERDRQLRIRRRIIREEHDMLRGSDGRFSLPQEAPKGWDRVLS